MVRPSSIISSVMVAPLPHGFGQLPVEFGSSAVGVSAARASPVDSSGFDHMEMYTPITVFPDVPHDPVNADGFLNLSQSRDRPLT